MTRIQYNATSIMFPQSVKSSPFGAMLHIFEDIDAVIKMIMKGRSPTMSHVSRTHRVALDWLFDRINLDPKIQIKYVDTENHLADILTKGNFIRDEWNNLLHLCNISCNPIDSSLQGNVSIPNDFFEYIYQIGCAINLHSIIKSGLIPG